MSQGPEAEEARVVALEFETAHDSEGLVVVVLAHANGARSHLRLDGEAVRGLIETLSLGSVGDLEGLRFSEIAPGLPANRVPRSE